jgi:transposase
MSVKVGIDVGSKELVVVIRKEGKPSKPQKFENDAQGHRALCRRLQGSQPVQVCLEATGVLLKLERMCLWKTVKDGPLF